MPRPSHAPPPLDGGGACDGVENGGLPYAPEDSADFFSQYVLEGVKQCAFCHYSGLDPAMDDENAHDVMRESIELAAASASETAAGKLFRLDGALFSVNHDVPFPDGYKANAKLWIENHLFGPCAGGTPVTPIVDAGQPPDAAIVLDAGCEDGTLDGNAVALLTEQMSNEVFDAFRSQEYCTNCHVAPQAQGGFQYNPANKAALTQSLLDSGRIEAGRSAAETTLGYYMNLGAPTNPLAGIAAGIHQVASANAGFSDTLRGSTEDFLEQASYQLALVSCNPPDLPPPPDVDVPPDVEPPPDVIPSEDVEPPPDVVIEDVEGPVCEPQPYAEADSIAYFNANLLTPVKNCAFCHYGSVQPVMNDTTAHDVLKLRIETNLASAAQTMAGQVLRVDGASRPGHNYNFSASPQAKIWIENHLHGVLPAGCE